MGGEARPLPHVQRVETLISAFERQFGRRPEGIAEAPGRVNLIGEHVDYNDGLVLPFAFDRSVLCAWGRRDDGHAVFRSLDDEQYIDFSPGSRSAAEHQAWFDYPVAVLTALLDEGFDCGDFDALVSGDVAQGAGLSSSAALEVAMAGALRDVGALAIDDAALARLCQRAENEYVGVQCGIMDQFASALSRRGHVLLIDCRTLAYEHVPLRLADAGLAIVIANSAVKRELASSAYNDRRRECEQAVRLLRELLGRPELSSLRDVTLADLDLVMDDNPAATERARATSGVSVAGGAWATSEDVPLRRARHVASEIARVAAVVEALRSDDFATVGELMGESHRSLRDDYDVSSQELDLLVGLATAQDYVLGARLTGAGFGGCTVNIVRADAIDAFERDVIATYRERTGLPAQVCVTSPQDGLRSWRIGV